MVELSDHQRVDLDPHGVELAGAPDALELAQGVGQRLPGRERDADHGSLLVAVVGGVGAHGHGSEQVGDVGQVQQGQGVVERTRLPGDRGQPRGGRQVGLGAVGELALGEAGGVPADQRLQDRQCRVADDDDSSSGPDQSGGTEPAPQRLLRRRAGPPGPGSARCRG